jgi:hypothetical protein
LAMMKLVKRVCVQNKVAAMVVIHQPSGYIFETFDQLILLARGGHCVFSDYQTKLPQLYETVFRKTMPTSFHEVPLDLLATLRNFVPDKETQLIPTNNNINNNINNNNNSTPAEYTSTMLDTTHTTAGSSNHNNKLLLDRPNEQPIVPITVQFTTVFYRNLVNQYVRNVTNLVARLLLYVLIAVLDGALFWKMGNETNPEIQSFLVGAFAFLFLGSYLLPFATISTFTAEKAFVLTERELGLYSPWIYCICQAILEFWIVTLAEIMQTCILVPMCALWSMNTTANNFESFFTVMAIFIASGLVGSNLVLLFAIAMPSQELAFLSGAGFVTFALGVSGGFVPFGLLQGFIQWGEWISPAKYSVQALSIHFFRGSPVGDGVLESRDLERPQSITSNIVTLLCFNGVLVVLTIVALSTKRLKR